LIQINDDPHADQKSFADHQFDNGHNASTATRKAIKPKLYSIPTMIPGSARSAAT
jgi:hypothetical protein